MRHLLFTKIRSFIPNFIKRNFGRKIVAIFFAVLVYMKVSTQLGEELVLQRIPVHVVAHGSIDVMNYLPSTVDVTISGSKQKVKLITPSDVRIEIPITKEILKQHNFELNKTFSISINNSNIHLPQGINLIRVIPEDIAIHCDKRIRKDVPVTPTFRGNPPLDYERGEVDVIPKAVSLTGPETILKDIITIPADPVYLDKTTVEDFMVDRKIQPIDKKILVSPESVQVKVEIYKTMETRVFDNIPVSVLLGKLNTKLGFKPKLLSHSVNITLRGPNSQLEMLTKSKIKAFVDISRFNKPGIYKVKVDCWINDSRITVKFIEPAMLNIELLLTSSTENLK